jgi:hypothetical protein
MTQGRFIEPLVILQPWPPFAEASAMSVSNVARKASSSGGRGLLNARCARRCGDVTSSSCAACRKFRGKRERTAFVRCAASPCPHFLRGAVERVADDRMSQRRHVDANLMGAAGIDLNFDQREFSKSRVDAGGRRYSARWRRGRRCRAWSCGCGVCGRG